MSDNIKTRWEIARQEIADAAAKAKVDPGTMAKIAGFESQYDPGARPIASHKHAELNTVKQFDGVHAMSSAYGYGQFTDATWASMIRLHGEKYGVANASKLTDTQANAANLRADSSLQAYMLAEFTKKNMDKGAELGGPDADANVYALHNLGASAGAKFLSALKQDPSERVDAILSKQIIERNPALYGDGSRSVESAYKVMGQQMDHYAEYARDVRQLSPSLAPAAHITLASHAYAEIRQVHAPQESTSSYATLLKEGMRGNDVLTLQAQLGALGYRDSLGRSLNIDGHFGAQTKAAVEAFQNDHHLLSDGVVGPLTGRQLSNQSQLQTATERSNAVPPENILSAAEESHRVTANLSPALPTFADPKHPQHAMYEWLKAELPIGTSLERLMQATAACHMAGMNEPKDLFEIQYGDKSVFFSPGALIAQYAVMDLTQAAPSVQQSMQQSQAYDQQQALFLAHTQERQRHQAHVQGQSVPQGPHR